MHSDIPIVRLIAAIACQASDDTVRARWAVLPPDSTPRLLAAASTLGQILALDAAAERVEMPQDLRRQLAALGALASFPRDASLELLADIASAGGPAERAIVIKGAALTSAFPEAAHRLFVDADVIVMRDDAALWLEAARQCGAVAHALSGYEIAHLSRGRGLVELHVALPGFAGNDPGPAWDALRARSNPIAGAPWLVPDTAVAREIAVQHFLFHHGGDASHALRVLQDLTLLETSGEGPGLDWGNSAVGRATERLREIARAIRNGLDDRPDAADYLSGIACAVSEATARSFAEESRAWLGQKQGLGGKAALLTRRLIPPLREMRRSADESIIAVGARYLARPFTLLAKYGAANRADRSRESVIAEWRREVERLIR